jgi:hypothetical protein
LLDARDGVLSGGNAHGTLSNSMVQIEISKLIWEVAPANFDKGYQPNAARTNTNLYLHRLLLFPLALKVLL